MTVTMTEWQIRMSQAGIEPEEPIVEPYPAWKQAALWLPTIAVCLTIVGGGAYWAWGALG